MLNYDDSATGGWVVARSSAEIINSRPNVFPANLGIQVAR
jgi:hypothetical protein